MAKKKLYYRIDFVNCDSIDYDYTIVIDLPEINNYLDGVLDCEDLKNKDASLKITGVMMTEKQYADFIASVEQ